MSSTLSLNADQLAAVHHDGGPMRIMAGAGSGKTQTLMHRFAHLVDSGIREDRILCVTYSRKAAGELERRIRATLGTSGHRSLCIRTFHSFSLRLIDDWNRHHSLPAPKVLDEEQRWSLIREVIASIPESSFHAHAGELGREKLISALSSFSDQVRDLLMSPDEVDRYARDSESSPGRLHDLALAHRCYVEAQNEKGLFDYAAMGFAAIEQLHRDPELLDEVRGRFDAMLIDEFQDANHAQFELVRLLDPDGRRTCVVGDVNQAIYAFRGGRSRYMRDFAATFPGTRTYALRTNYRSGQLILDAANALIRHNGDDGLLELQSHNPPKPATVRATPAASPAAEAASIVRAIASMTRRPHSSVRYADIAILLRSTERSAAVIEQALAANGIPFRTSTKEAVNVEIVRDVLAALRLIAGPPCWPDAARLAARDHSVAGALRQIESIVADPEALNGLMAGTDATQYDLSVPQFQAVEVCRMLVARAERHRNEPLPELTYAALLLSGRLDERLDRQTARTLRSFVDQATTIADSGGGAAELVQHLTAGYGQIPWQHAATGEGVTILTVHSAKGLEWPVVFVAGMADGEFPLPLKLDRDFDPDALWQWKIAPGLPVSERERQERFLEEERRLAYVAMTRARSELHLTWPRASSSGGSLRPSQFIAEANLAIPGISVEPAQGLFPVSTSDLPHVLRTWRNTALATTLDDPAFPRHLTGLMLEQSAALNGRAGATRLLERQLPKTYQDGIGLQLSFSQLNQYETCPRSYFYARTLALDEVEESHYFTFGSAVHAALNELNGQWRERRQVPGPATIASAVERNWPEKGFVFETQTRQLRQRAEAMLQRYYAWEASLETPRIPVLIEHNFRASWGEHSIRGRIDAVLQSADGAIEIVDYKTSARTSTSISKPAESLQLFIYDYAHRHAEPDAQPTVAYYALRHDADRGFITGPTWDERQIKRHTHSDESRSALHERIDQIITGITADAFDPAPSYAGCRGCAYRWVCPEGNGS